MRKLNSRQIRLATHIRNIRRAYEQSDQTNTRLSFLSVARTIDEMVFSGIPVDSAVASLTSTGDFFWRDPIILCAYSSAVADYVRRSRISIP